jgi:peptide-methionine (S)-S-oxide reductase
LRIGGERINAMPEGIEDFVVAGDGWIKHDFDRFSMAGAASAQTKTETATLAGGCFWCLESDMDKVPGVISTTSGYTSGQTLNPTYSQVSAGGTGHTEAVKIVFDPAITSYDKILDAFWHGIDPLTANAQFCDHGSQYRSGIYYSDEKQKKAAEASKAKLEASGVLKGKIVTEIVAATTFYPAEEYHQDYYLKNPTKYKYYRFSCGRDARVKEIWGAAAAGH